jgi:hypothetical protein
LIGLGLASAGVALLLAAVAITAYDQVTFRATKLDNVTAVAEVVGHNAAAALAFDDAASGAKILSGLRAKPSIGRAALYRRAVTCPSRSRRRHPCPTRRSSARSSWSSIAGSCSTASPSARFTWNPT